MRSTTSATFTIRWRRRSLPLLLVLAAAVLLPAPLFSAASEAGSREQERQRMVAEQIVARGVRDRTTLAAIRSVPRHLFVPPDHRRRAYADVPLPIGFGQTISQPYIVAFMTEQVRPRRGKRILEIGTGSGYQAAVLAATGAEVFSIEIIPELARSAASRLAELSYGEVRVRQGDGYFGWPEHAPYDAIIVTAAAPYIPPPLLEQLAEDGRMLIPVGSPFLVQSLTLVEKRSGDVVTRSLMPVRFVPFRRTE